MFAKKCLKLIGGYLFLGSSYPVDYLNQLLRGHSKKLSQKVKKFDVVGQVEMNRQSVTPFTQIAENTDAIFSLAPPVQIPAPLHDDMFAGATQGISQTQVMETVDNHHHPFEVRSKMRIICFNLLR